MRYFAWMKLGQRTSHERLARTCFIDYDRQIALVAESNHERTGDRQIIGVEGWSSRPAARRPKWRFSSATPIRAKAWVTR